MKTVVFSPAARSFVHREAIYLRQRNIQAAERFLQRLREMRRLLGRFYEAGFETHPIRGMRRLIVDAYIIYYMVEADRILVVSFRHARQQEPDAAFDQVEDFEPKE